MSFADPSMAFETKAFFEVPRKLPNTCIALSVYFKHPNQNSIVAADCYLSGGRDEVASE